ncbi:saccharopine dehydrogenase NADP-binding domain-containing protein [Arenicella sp. 4NH20-0111]|uniref:saccharopine dehydrogenase family protein n=1 Tax=Arenicella sp. 4NH20-0111 TaxID=3127648 RepID=UPI003106D81C
MADRKYDIVVYGATGFTGRLVAQYLQSQYQNHGDLVWAMAGRNEEKLRAVRDEIGLPKDTPFVVANSDDTQSMQAMVDSARVVLTTVGPYQMYGSELVGLCAKSGTDYVDLCGESVWMRHMIDAYEQDAKKSGSRIVFSCGFDSIPSDLGIFKLQSLAIEKTGKPATHVSGRVRKMKGTFSGGTAASLQASVKAAKTDPEVFKLAIDPFALVPDFAGVAQPDGESVHYSEELGSWVAPFIMAAINTRNVHRSNALLGFQYGKDFTYDEMMLTGPGEQGEAIANHVKNDTSMAGPDAPKPGEGPSKEERESGFYDIMYIGELSDGNKMIVGVKGDRDPGYGSTSKMISESAVCLVKDATDTPGGLWTTAPAMGDKLIARLEKNAGLEFTHEA